MEVKVTFELPEDKEAQWKLVFCLNELLRGYDGWSFYPHHKRNAEILMRKLIHEIEGAFYEFNRNR